MDYGHIRAVAGGMTNCLLEAAAAKSLPYTRNYHLADADGRGVYRKDVENKGVERQC